MTTLADKLEALAARCEAAEGADRDLDERIGMAIGLKRTIRIGHECLGNDREVPVNCPLYTASIDAALTLVPDGARLSVSSIASPGFHAAVMGYGHRAEGFARATTPALALAAAALRARTQPNNPAIERGE